MTRYVPGGNSNANVHETILQEYTADNEVTATTKLGDLLKEQLDGQ